MKSQRRQTPMIARATISVLLSLVVLGPSLSQDGSDVNRKGDRVIRRGDRVVWIGNTLAERMQYYGEVESRLHARYPQHELVVRNLSWSADTVIRRRRPKGFGDIHRYLSNAKADVILACYGLTETWDYDGQKGVAKFRDDLTKFLRSLLGQKYNGESAPRIVLYSPIACEPGRLPDFAERLRLLELYSLAMKETAAAQSVAFVDLFTPSRQLFRASSKPTHTINGIHLTADGYTKLADAFFPDSLFAALPAAAPLDAIRTEVLEKNDSFFKWYRTVNSFYIHGDRARPYGVVNFPAERKKLLEMTTLRDRRIWKAARGEVLPTAVDDSSTTKVPQAIRGTRGGVSPALSPAAEREKFVVAEGFRVELFASEKEFPELRNPVAMQFDSEGRLWISTMPSYPHAFPGVKPNDLLLVLEDTDGDGKADKRTTFADGLYLPLGFELGYGGVFLSQEPNLVFLEDTNDDGKADKETILLHGFGSEDCHHAIHNFVWGPGGGLYMQESVFHNTQVETVFGPRRSKDNAIFRFDPRTHRFDVAAPLPPGGNPWGHAVDRWGQHLYVARHLNASLVRHPTEGYVRNAAYGNKDARNCGQEFIRSRHWPDEYQGLVFTNQYKNYQGVLLHDWSEKGSSFSHKRLVNVFEAHNKSCIPVDLQLGPDGALYVADWYNPVLGHMQYSLRDERRDTKLGRIWRITWKDRALDTPPKIAGASPRELLDLLKAYEDRTRYRARREIWNLSEDVLKPALKKWLASLAHDSGHTQHADHASHEKHELGTSHHLTEALWLHQQRGWVNEDLFRRVSTSHNFNARAAAAHVLRFWADELPDARSHFVRLARDAHPRVRLEAIASSSWTESSIAVEVLEITRDLPQDTHVRLAWNNVKSALGPALANHPMALPVEKLAALPLSAQVIKAVLRRPKLPASLREKVLGHLASTKKTTVEAALASVLVDLDTRGEASLPNWLDLLDSRKIADRKALDALLSSKTPKLRQAAFAALLRAGHLTTPPIDADALRAVSRLESRELQRSFLDPARGGLSSDRSIETRKAAVFALGQIPGDDDQIFNTLAKFFADPVLGADVADAILARPIQGWPAESDELLKTHLPRLVATPVAERGERSFVASAQLLRRIADRNRSIDTVLKIDALKLIPVRIGTVADRMKYDRATIRVPADTPIELRLVNADSMKHNLVICAPGSLEKVGLAVDALVSDPSAMARDWIPGLPEVLHSTPMANPGQSAVVRFISPKTPGSYPFLCSVPNHWRIMQGTMVVESAETLSKKKPNVLIVTGEPEYGTRASLAELKKSLQKEHDLNITHLEVDRKAKPHRIPDLEKRLPRADLLVLSLRFVDLAPNQYRLLDEYLSERPFIAIRTTTHLFQFPSQSKLATENRDFPDRHFGTPYRGHHGHSSSQLNYVMAANHPVLDGVEPRLWTPDFLYAVNPLSIDCTPLMVGQALKGRERATFQTVRPHNHARVLSKKDATRLTGSPHPVVWTVDNVKSRRALVTTIGARKSFADPSVRRLYRNAVLWCLGRDTRRPAEPVESILAKESLVALAESARKGGHVERGRRLFYNAALGCAKCHDPKAGRALGPNLFEKRDAKDSHLVQSILKPSAVIREGYQNALVVTRTGETRNGFLVDETNRTLKLRDSTLGETTWEFKKSELAAWRRLNTSTMPEGLVNLLESRAEFLDLVRFVMAGAEGSVTSR